ncbi:MAG: hypothetical protein KC656_25920, partial [Myxococcales bacterium]|nr:hypothetical protein [Myxococcales bacterium]
MWGILGVVGLLGSSVVRLAGPAVELVHHALGPVHLVVLVVWVAFMLYAEAWRGFHKQFSPRVVQRAFTLPDVLHVRLLAPVVCMGLVHATRKRRIVGWSLVTGIVLLVIVVRQLAQPWRGIVDVGVVLGLAGGTLSIVWHAVRALQGTLPGVPADWPE